MSVIPAAGDRAEDRQDKDGIDTDHADPLVIV